MSKVLSMLRAEWRLFCCTHGVHIGCTHAHVVTDPACRHYVAPATRAQLHAHRRARGWACWICTSYASRWLA